MKFPKSINQGSSIGVVAPSFGATTEPYSTRFNEAVKNFTDKGYTVIPGKCCFMSDGKGISTKPEIAARELEAYYLNPTLDALISCGGGELMCETIGHVDFEKLKDAPAKWFMGYSDNTNFIFPLVTICDTAAIYGQCFPTFGCKWHESETAALNILEGKSTTVKGFEKYQSPQAHDNNSDPLSSYILDTEKTLTGFICKDGKAQKADINHSFNFSGTMIGGCMDVLNSLAGTKFDNVKAFNEKYKNVLWVLEACDYNVMDIRRCLWHLDQCGWFENAAGFVFGKPLSALNQEIMGVNQYNAVTDILEKYNKPIICDADVGHIDPAMPLVMGSWATVKVTGNEITIEQEFKS